MIAERAAGNPFFAQEITRELAERGVLVGERGGYTCRTDVAEVSVPATLQATIAARIDRLDPAAKHTLAAAAVIGSRFSSDLLTAWESIPASTSWSTPSSSTKCGSPAAPNTRSGIR